MNKTLFLLAVLVLCAVGKSPACWYATYEPQYYLTFNLSDDTYNPPSSSGMVRMWQKLLPGASENEIKALIYPDGYSLSDIRSLTLTPALKTALCNDPELHNYVILMRQVNEECEKTVDPWYFYYDNDPKLQTLKSLAEVALERINSRYGDRYAVLASRTLKALKRYDEIIDLSKNHTFSDNNLQALFDENLAGAYYYTGNYDKALEYYRKSGDLPSLRWTLAKLGYESGSLGLAGQLSMEKGNESAIIDLLQSHVRELELKNDENSGYGYCRHLSLPEIGNLISTARQAQTDGLECYKPIWQYTEGFSYLINPVDYAKADSVFAQIDLNRASPHLQNQVRTLRFITQSHMRPYDEQYKVWFAKEASWLCETGTKIIDEKFREERELLDSEGLEDSSFLEDYHLSFGDVIFDRNTHKSFCYPLDMLHRAVDCIVVPKMLAANDTVSALQVLDLVDHAGLTKKEIQLSDSHGCASICFAMECGADIAEACRTTLKANNQWSSLIKNNGSITAFPDRWNDLIGTLLLAEGRYDEAIGYFSRVSAEYAAERSASCYDTNRNPFALRFIANKKCKDEESRLKEKQPYYKEWFAREMSLRESIMQNPGLPQKERALAGVEYAVGLSNSIYPCWSLTRYGLIGSEIFPYHMPNEKDDRRATEIIHNYISEETYTVDRPTDFDLSHKRLQNLRRKSEKIFKENIAMLDNEDAAEIYAQMTYWSTVKHRYPDTAAARRLKSSCDGWEDW